MVDICGIYMIENIVNKKVYIGQSSAINKRFSQHIAKLNSNTHTNSHLQAAWNKYGQGNFIFSIIEECTDGELDSREVYWIQKYDSYVNGYNATYGGGGKRGWRTPPEVIAKRSGSNSATSKKVVCVNTGEVFDCIVDASEKYGIHKSLITMCCRQKIKSCGGRITGVPSVWLYYDEYAKMSKPEVEQYLQARIVTNTENYVREKKSVKCSSGVIYNSIREASKLTGICETSIWKCCNGLRNNAGGFSWEHYFSESVVI